MLKERVSSGIPNLDPHIGGGFVKGSINLISGGTGSGKTIALAHFLYEGAEKGDPRAMYAVGSMYAGGAGVEQDFKKAYQWLNKAAIYNRWDAQYKTGLMHYMGMGIPRNYKKAALVYKTLAVKEKGEISLIAGDILDCIPDVFKKIV